MQFNTAFNCGDEVWIYFGPYYKGVQQATIGQIRISYTDTRLYEDEETGYGELVKEYKETYMCKETGVGSGTVHELGVSIFKTKEECEKYYAKHIAEEAAEEARRKKAEIKRKLANEDVLRAQLAEIEKIKAEGI